MEKWINNFSWKQKLNLTQTKSVNNHWMVSKMYNCMCHHKIYFDIKSNETDSHRISKISWKVAITTLNLNISQINVFDTVHFLKS